MSYAPSENFAKKSDGFSTHHTHYLPPFLELGEILAPVSHIWTGPTL